MGVILFAGLIRVSFVLSEGNSNAPKKLRLENKKGARSLINVNNLWEGNAMKRVNKIGMGLIILLSTVFSQTDISFKFGLPLSSAQLLLKERTVGGLKVVPTIRTGYFHIGQSMKSEVRDESDGAHILVPSLGIRVGQNKIIDLKRYWLADFFTVVPIFTGTDKKDIKKEWDSQFDPIVGMIGGYGVEYFLSEQFSLGGEVSMNLVMNKWKNENRDENDYGDNENISEDYRLTAGAVFTQFIFNYYFD